MLAEQGDCGLHLLTLKQAQANDELLGSPARHLCLVGGARSGKTALIVRAMIIRGLVVPCTQAILRFRQNSVWPSVGLQTIPFVINHFWPQGLRHRMHLSDHYLELLDTGSQIWLGGLDEKSRVDKILGKEYLSIFFNECSEIPYNSVLIALSRLAAKVAGMRQRAYYDLNPLGLGHWTNMLFGEHRNPLTKHKLDDPHNYKRFYLNPRDHAEHLDPDYLASLDAMPARIRARFRDGVYVDEVASALWTFTGLEACRITRAELPPLQRVVVGVDPSGAANSLDLGHDPIGIVVVGRGADGHAYVLADDTLLAGPNEWGRAAVAAYHAHKADRIVAEVNFGGAMVEYVIRTVDGSVPVTLVTASRGKVQRAEPVSALYAQGKVHHVGRFDALEDEQVSFSDSGFTGLGSPNRCDALVWALTELMLGENASGWVDYYKSRHERIVKRDEEIAATAPGIRLQTALDQALIKLKAPDPFMAYYVTGPDGQGKRYVSDGDASIEAHPRHLAGLIQAGCVQVEETIEL